MAYALLGAAVVAAGAALSTSDPQGRLLALGAIAFLGAVSLNDLLVAPRLAVSADGLQIRTIGARARLQWAEIEEIRVDERPRFGLARRALEIDAGPVLAVFSQHALGRDPRDVLALIEAYRG